MAIHPSTPQVRPNTLFDADPGNGTNSGVSKRSDIAMVRPLSLCVLMLLVCATRPKKISDRRGPLNLSFSKMAVFNEEECSREGGQCLEREECPEGKLTNKGLCPEQQKRGVECCMGVQRSLKDCQSLGGVCRDSCDARILIKEAEDCKPQVCCALVQ